MDPSLVIRQMEELITSGLTSQVLARKLLVTIILVVVFVILRRGLIRAVDGRVSDPESRYRWARAIGYVVWVLAFFVIGGVWIDAIGSLATVLAIVGAGLAIALRDPIVNLGGWAYIVWRRPLSLGDRVEVDMTRGDVVSIGPFVFSLAEVGTGIQAEQMTGRIVHVPNSYVFANKVINSTQGFDFVWDEIPVLVTFESDWRVAKETLNRIAQERVSAFGPEAEEQMRHVDTLFMIPRGSYAPRVFTSVEDCGVLLTMRYVVPVRRRRATREEIWEEVLTEFGQSAVLDFAYPTRRIFSNPTEGKPGIGSVSGSPSEP